MVGTSVAVVLLAASSCWQVSSAGADQVSSIRDQISAAQAAVVAGAGRVRQLTLAYAQASVWASTLAQQVDAEQAQLTRLQAQLDGTQVSLRREALLSYVGGFTGLPAPVGKALPRPVSDPAVRAEYAGLAASDLRDAVDEYRTQRSQVATAAVAVAEQQQASQAATAAVDEARTAALNEAAFEQTQLNGLQGRLTQLLAAAQAASHRQQQAVGLRTQGLPVNNGIVAVVRDLVGSAPVTSFRPARSARTGARPSPQPVASATSHPSAKVLPRVPVHPPATSPPAPPPPPTTTPPTTPAPPATPPPPPAAAPPSPPSSGVWLQLRECESGNNYRANTGNGFFGAYQFSQQTWSGLGYPGRPDLEPPAMQDQAAMKLQGESGWASWSACAAALGLV
jgi:hypothetical protein